MIKLLSVGNDNDLSGRQITQPIFFCRHFFVVHQFRCELVVTRFILFLVSSLAEIQIHKKYRICHLEFESSPKISALFLLPTFHTEERDDS